MYDDKGNRKAVPYYHTDEAHKTLGVMLEPDNNNILQIARIRNMTIKFSDRCVWDSYVEMMSFRHLIVQLYS